MHDRARPRGALVGIGRRGRHAAPGRSWLPGGGVAAGGAASLAVGAVLGGALAGVPNLLAPPAAGPAARTTSTGAPAPHGLALQDTRAAARPGLIGVGARERHEGLVVDGDKGGGNGADAGGRVERGDAHRRRWLGPGFSR